MSKNSCILFSSKYRATSDDIKRNAEIASEFEPTVDQTYVENQQQHLNESLPVALNDQILPEEEEEEETIVGFDMTTQKSNDDVKHLQEKMQAIKMNNYKKRECARCEDDVYPGQVVVTADKINDAVWHPGCFKCCACNELLVDLVYFTYKDRLYCGRDLAKLLEIPRCYACDEVRLKFFFFFSLYQVAR